MSPSSTTSHISKSHSSPNIPYPHYSHCEQNREAHASGKVLLTGGYLILFPKYRGISIALNCQFHSTIDVYSHPNTIIIDCPQWIEPQLTYNIDSKLNIIAATNQMANPFIQYSLQCIFQYLHDSAPSELDIIRTFGLRIRLHGDDAFYNKGSTTSNDIDNGLNSVKEKKMGLGSSAALTVSLIRCLFSFFRISTESTESTKLQSDLHGLCQISHFLSQGKIGSGFDIATALFGSILFRRSSLNIERSEFQRKLDIFSTNNTVSKVTIRDILDCMVMAEMPSIKIPSHLCIIMGVPMSSFGTKTPKMVSKVLNWREQNPSQCEGIWTALNTCNECLITILEELQSIYDRIGEVRYIKGINQWCNGEEDTDGIGGKLIQLRDMLQKIREYQIEISTQSGVDIVPKVMNEILNKTAELDCVIEGGIPGAGGFDALFVLCVGDRESVCSKLRSLWSTLDVQILDV